VSDAAPTPPTAAALFRRFFGLGCTAFGGPVVQIETLHREFAGDGRLVTSERFRRALVVYQALPGPEATEMCIWLGTVARGRLGGLLAGLGFALPGFVLMLTAAWLLQGDAAWPAWLQATVAGMQGGAVALLLRAARRLFVAGTRRQAIPVAIALAAAIGAFAQVPFAVALVAGGLALLSTGLPRRMALGANGGRGSPGLLLVVLVSWLMLGFWLAPGAPANDTAALAIAAGSAELGTLATTGLQAGLLTFGGAYTAIPFLQDAATGPQRFRK
jgi:chromate transporter